MFGGKVLSSPSVQVVIVDDDSSVRWIIEQSLDLAGISYVSAATGAQGIELINLHRPPLAIVDLKLGAMSGLDVLRGMACPRQTKALLITGYASSLRDQLKDLPVLAVMEKPFDIQDLLRVVEEALRPSA